MGIKDWKAVQKMYDENILSIRDLSKIFKVSYNTLDRGIKKGLLKKKSEEDVSKLISYKGTLRKVSDETKKKISESRIKYLKENPDKVPYLLNHSRKESYPEKYFKEYFFNENINIEKKFRIGLYELDFCIKDKKIDIEIDGEQHYLDKKRIIVDEKRNKYLEDNGWDVIRIRWSSYMKMDKDEKDLYLNNLKNYLKNLIDKKPLIKFKDLRKCECGKIKNKRSKICIECYRNKFKK